MTTKPGSGSPLEAGILADAHQPNAKARIAAVASATGPAIAAISHPMGSAASDPQVPGISGKRPMPPTVAINAAGWVSGRPSRAPAIRTTAFPAKAGTDPATVSLVDGWIPAFAGNAVLTLASRFRYSGRR